MRDLRGSVVFIVRRCRRCGQWRRIGRFTHARYKGRNYCSRACDVCRAAYPPREGLGRFYTLTPAGRALLLELAEPVAEQGAA